MPLFVHHARLHRLRRAYRAYRSGMRPAGPFALALAVAVTGHLVASSAGAESPAPTARALYRVHEPPYAMAGAAPAVPAAPRVAARSSRSTGRVAPARPVPARRWLRPTRGPVTSPYGMRWGRMHEGLDFGAPYGAAVVTTYDGVVVHAGYGLSGYGKQVRVRHTDGSVTSYSHLSSIAVRSGARVVAGQQIGRVGSTGNVTGPHLHFEALVGGRPVNPRAFLRQRGLSL